jgi:hypothetical protein
MAVRTPSEIYESYYDELQAQTALADLEPQADDAQTLAQDVTTTSKVAEHRIWLWVFSLFSWMMEVLFDAHRTEVDARVQQARFGTLQWWVLKMKAFQYGYALAVVDDFFTYVDTTSSGAVASRIVTRAAAISLGGGDILLKAAKEPVADEPEALSGSERDALEEYCRMIQPAGPTVTVLSLNADRLRLTATCYYDPLLINPDGTLISDGSTRPVDDAIRAYLKAIPFNGVMSITHLIDAVQAVAGVNDFTVQTAEYRPGASVSYTVINRVHETVSGYMREEDAPYAFEDTITYTPGN